MNWRLRPTAARRRLIKDQERAEEYKEWLAAKNSQLQQHEESHVKEESSPTPAVVHNEAQDRALPPQ